MYTMAKCSFLTKAGFAIAAFCLLLSPCFPLVSVAVGEGGLTRTIHNGSFNQNGQYDAIHAMPDAREEDRGESPVTDSRSQVAQDKDEKLVRSSSSRGRARRSSTSWAYLRSSYTGVLSKVSGTASKFLISAVVVGVASLSLLLRAGDAFWKCLADVGTQEQRRTGSAPRALSSSGGKAEECLHLLVEEPGKDVGAEQTPRGVLFPRLLLGLAGVAFMVLALAFVVAYSSEQLPEEEQQGLRHRRAATPPDPLPGMPSVRESGEKVVIGEQWKDLDGNLEPGLSAFWTVPWHGKEFVLHPSNRTATNLGERRLTLLMNGLQANPPVEVAGKKEVEWGRKPEKDDYGNYPEREKQRPYSRWTVQGTNYTVFLPRGIVTDLGGSRWQAGVDTNHLLKTAVRSFAEVPKPAARGDMSAVSSRHGGANRKSE